MDPIALIDKIDSDNKKKMLLAIYNRWISFNQAHPMNSDSSQK